MIDICEASADDTNVEVVHDLLELPDVARNFESLLVMLRVGVNLLEELLLAFLVVVDPDALAELL